MSSGHSSTDVAEQTDVTPVEFKSDYGRVLQTEAINMIDMLTVTVGTGAETVKFPVHEALLRKSSLFFDNAMKPEWAASKLDPRDVDLTDEDPEVFKVYLHWLYMRTLPTVHRDLNLRGQKHEFDQLSNCYILGEKLMDVRFKNAILDGVVDAMNNTPFCTGKMPGEASINIIYSGTSEGSPARRLLVDIWVMYAGENWIKHLTDKLPHEFVLEFSRALLKDKCNGKKDTRRWRTRMEDYHE
ncbi:hypothetical protein N0V83_008184 [Neocucurbitaria cava]|uniref:BTB domain-containing protein n=1 Tax=Neocucurbitaria cava TaxID=798079 RepID=A0A9W8Y449_9PLEO|nr:hypothetical protein N0V83_008184 [Neocucurbitaria cava]